MLQRYFRLPKLGIPFRLTYKRPETVRGAVCLNCGQTLEITHAYCPACGQQNKSEKLSLNDFFNEFFAGILAYDSRGHHTIGALLFAPGKISRDYVKGKRIRYANPYRFYLSVSIVFFLIWGLTQVENSQPADQIGSQTNESTLLPVLLSEMEHVAYTRSELAEVFILERPFKKIHLFFSHYIQTGQKDATVALKALELPISSWNQWLYEKALEGYALLQEPNLFLTYFTAKLPFIIFFFLPVFSLFLWLLYFRHPLNYMEHLIFTFHNQTTFFVFYGMGLLASYMTDMEWITDVMSLLFLLYLFGAFLRFYEQSSVKTILKFVIVNIIFFTLALIGTLFSVLASFAIY